MCPPQQSRLLSDHLSRTWETTFPVPLCVPIHTSFKKGLYLETSGLIDGGLSDGGYAKVSFRNCPFRKKKKKTHKNKPETKNTQTQHHKVH